jgi:hypothetical protein
MQKAEDMFDTLVWCLQNDCEEPTEVIVVDATNLTIIQLQSRDMIGQFSERSKAVLARR